MPSPRLFAGTFTRFSAPAPAANSTVPPTETMPESGCSRPAIDRSVVVLPHPDGPNRVNSSPSLDREADVVDGENPCGRVAVGRLFLAGASFLALAVERLDQILNFKHVGCPFDPRSILFEADLGPELVGDGDQHDKRQHHDDAQRRQAR